MLLRSPRIGKLITRCALTYARANVLVSDGLEHSRASLQAFLGESLTSAEKSSLAQYIYGRREVYGPAALYAWERFWYQRDLPLAPAHVLVGGCGSGREMLALIDAGYQVSGFEPAAGLYQAACRALPDNTHIWQLRYEDISHASAARELVAQAPYDAVILGWGSFSHVLELSMRERVIQILHRLCPRGPILLSYQAASPNGLAKTSNSVERAARQIGGGLRNLRGLPAPSSESDVFLPHAGFVHRFTDVEIQELAKLVNRNMRSGGTPGTYAHCSFVLETGCEVDRHIADSDAARRS